jgi:S-adenosylmethionine:tRNA ribosyltransferase-isomerase
LEIRLDDYDYQLPADRIAQEPASRREDARLLVLDRSSSRQTLKTFGQIGEHLRPGDLLVLNDARVFPARLFARRSTGGRVEVFLLGPAPSDPPRWQALLRPARAGRKPEAMALEGEPRAAVRAVEEEEGGRFRVEVLFAGEPLDAAGVLALCEKAGEMPLPPYISRSPGDQRRSLDRERYQTVYARESVAVAAPTAGLHFSESLLQSLRERGIETAPVTLAVGAGTFQPLREESLRRGRLFEEEVHVPARSAEKILAARREGRRVVAVGTTSARTIESWMGAGAPLDGERGWTARTDLLIAPGHRFALVGALVTNFHLPRSSLLLLVSAFAGRERVLEAYRTALEAGFRFYSYGDAMLIV